MASTAIPRGPFIGASNDSDFQSSNGRSGSKKHASAEAFAHHAFANCGSKVILASDPSLADPLLAPLAYPRATPMAGCGSGSSDDDSEHGPSAVSMTSTTETNTSGSSGGRSDGLGLTMTPPGRLTPDQADHDHNRPNTLIKSNSTSSLQLVASGTSSQTSQSGLRLRATNRHPTTPAPSKSSTIQYTKDDIDSSSSHVPSPIASLRSGSSTEPLTDNQNKGIQAPSVAEDTAITKPLDADPDDPLAFSMDSYLERQASGKYLMYEADVRTLIWAFVFMPGCTVLHYYFPSLSWYIFPFSLYFSLAAAVIAHNHNHCPTFSSWRLNAFFGNWVSVFYGYPTYAWIPTHNLNHHRFVNRIGDSTITWRHTNEHNAAVASTYFFVSSYYQAGPISDYLNRAKARRHVDGKYMYIMLQYIWFITVHLSIFGAFVYRHGLGLGFQQYCFSSLGPALFSLWAIMFINYIQHVHCDAWHPYNHSRNFISPTLNYLLFNNGYHTAHHNNASLHWSLLPDLHNQMVPRVHPNLLVPSFWYFVFDSYLLALVSSRFGTKQIGRLPSDPPSELVAAAAAARLQQVKDASSASADEKVDHGRSDGHNVVVDGVKYESAFAQKLMKELMQATTADQAGTF